MPRRRRSTEEARSEILSAAETLLVREGPDALTLQRVAREVGVSHPAVLHHFRSAGRLREALHARVSRRLREAFLDRMSQTPAGDPSAGLIEAMSELSDPSRGRLLAWLVASSLEPFPDATERGLAGIAQALTPPGGDPALVRNKLLLIVLAMIGDSMVGDAVRDRIGEGVLRGDDFRRWVLDTLS